AFNAAHQVETIKPVLGQENTFLLRVLPEAGVDALSMANQYQESGGVVNAAPNFVRMVLMKPESPAEDMAVKYAPESPGPLAVSDDPLFDDLWFIRNTQQYGPAMTAGADIKAAEAWDITTGSPDVVIAIIDDGVDLTHEDLAANLVPGYDATGGGSAGSYQGNDAHGTNIAGLAAAVSNNGLGVAGVCPNCGIMPVRIAYTSGDYWFTSDAILAEGITWAYLNGAWILNNSWGGGLPTTVIDTAISNAKLYGRDGKGSVIIFSAGNGDIPSLGYPASLPEVIAVGASNLCDQRKAPVSDLCNGYEGAWGSDYGSDLDVTAPGVWLDSTDLMGANGYSRGNYYYYMNGTSGSAPIVAGIAGLVLAVQPDLMADQVQAILQDTADDVNGGGFDVEMGYGRVNAYRAVQAAQPPGGPELISPAGEIDNAAPVFAWKPFSGALFYFLWVRGVDEGLVFQQVFPAQEVCADETCEALLPAPLVNGTYTWSLQALTIPPNKDWAESDFVVNVPQ
ncbi:MAG: S8 family serine peptidase, partial [Chloroflexi bacterium]|nr:S8 family serine peptidase [Chloroflexota bacterium]